MSVYNISVEPNLHFTLAQWGGFTHVLFVENISRRSTQIFRANSMSNRLIITDRLGDRLFDGWVADG